MASRLSVFEGRPAGWLGTPLWFGEAAACSLPPPSSPVASERHRARRVRASGSQSQSLTAAASSANHERGNGGRGRGRKGRARARAPYRCFLPFPPPEPPFLGGVGGVRGRTSSSPPLVALTVANHPVIYSGEEGGGFLPLSGQPVGGRGQREAASPPFSRGPREGFGAESGGGVASRASPSPRPLRAERPGAMAEDGGRELDLTAAQRAVKGRYPAIQRKYACECGPSRRLLGRAAPFLAREGGRGGRRNSRPAFRGGAGLEGDSGISRGLAGWRERSRAKGARCLRAESRGEPKGRRLVRLLDPPKWPHSP